MQCCWLLRDEKTRDQETVEVPETVSDLLTSRSMNPEIIFLESEFF